MGAAQPANTSISVFQRVRTVRNNKRHTSIKHLTTPFDKAEVALPGDEVQVIEFRDATFKTDAFRFGHPVTVAPRATFSLAQVYAAVAGLDFPVRLIGNPREIQIQKSAANVGDDLFGQIRTAGPGAAFTNTCVGTPGTPCADIDVG